MKHWPPLFLGLEIDEEFGIKESGGVSPVVRTAHLTRALRNFRKRTKQDSSLVSDANPLIGPGAGCKHSPHPDRALIQVGQKFRSYDTTESQEISHQNCEDADTDGDCTVPNGPTDTGAIVLAQEVHDGVVPFASTLCEGEAGKYRRDQDREK